MTQETQKPTDVELLQQGIEAIVKVTSSAKSESPAAGAELAKVVEEMQARGMDTNHLDPDTLRRLDR